MPREINPKIRLKLSILHVIIILKEKNKLSESRIDANCADQESKTDAYEWAQQESSKRH